MGSVFVTENFRCPRTQVKVAVFTLSLPSAIQILQGAESAPDGLGKGLGVFKTIMKSCLEEERRFPDGVCLGYKALHCFQAVPLADNPAMID